ncbi:MAG: hypothetical protein AB7S70_02505 [Hyphomicrobium sp.]|uniref:hypothetical protein n=1 Tax=Hyphomicrobium sp. TaxID=82 RepID=UPI003D104D01
MVGLHHSHVQRIENWKRGLSVPVAERFAKALNKRIEEVLGVTSPGNATTKYVMLGGFNEDAEPYVEGPGQRLRVMPRKGENIDPWRIKSEACTRAGVKAGQVRFVDISAEAVENVKALQCVIAQIYGSGPEGRTVTIVRQFVPPSLLITNSDTVSEMPLDIDKGEAYIKGIILDDFTGA